MQQINHKMGPRSRATDEDTSATILAAIIRNPICQLYECLFLLCTETYGSSCGLPNPCFQQILQKDYLLKQANIS